MSSRTDQINDLRRRAAIVRRVAAAKLIAYLFGESVGVTKHRLSIASSFRRIGVALAFVGERGEIAARRLAGAVEPCDFCGTHLATLGQGDMEFCARHAELFAFKLRKEWIDAVDAATRSQRLTLAQANLIFAHLCALVQADGITKDDMLFDAAVYLNGAGAPLLDGDDGDTPDAASAVAHVVAAPVDSNNADDEPSAYDAASAVPPAVAPSLAVASSAPVAPPGMQVIRATPDEEHVVLFLNAQRLAGCPRYMTIDAIAEGTGFTALQINAIVQRLGAIGLVLGMGDMWRLANALPDDAPAPPPKLKASDRGARMGFRLINNPDYVAPPVDDEEPGDADPDSDPSPVSDGPAAA
jgi:hypothetical protein